MASLITSTGLANEFSKTKRQPVFLHMKTVRLLGHAGSDIEVGYKTLNEIETIEFNDPLLHTARIMIDKKLLSFAKKDCVFLHCLPRGKEVDEEIFSSIKSKVWQQAQNRVHVQKSILLYCLNKLR